MADRLVAEPFIVPGQELQALCGSWRDTRGSVYMISMGPLDQLDVCTKRPTGRVIETPGMISRDAHSGCISWGRLDLGHRHFWLEIFSVVSMSEPRPVHLVWKRPGSRSFEWFRDHDDPTQHACLTGIWPPMPARPPPGSPPVVSDQPVVSDPPVEHANIGEHANIEHTCAERAQDSGEAMRHLGQTIGDHQGWYTTRSGPDFSLMYSGKSKGKGKAASSSFFYEEGPGP